MFNITNISFNIQLVDANLLHDAITLEVAFDSFYRTCTSF